MALSSRAAFIALLGNLILPSALARAAPAFTSPAYASFVCWKYSHLPDLPAWNETGKIIATALAEAYPNLRQLDHVENGSRPQLDHFLRRLPDDADQITLVYLAGHQSHSGQWNFPDQSESSWRSLTTNLPQSKNLNRIVLLDCCHAQAASLWPGWSQKIAPATIFASAQNQLAPDLFVFRRHPVDWARQFPKSIPWLRQHHFDHLDERISFFGLVWLESWLDRAAPPRNLNQWKELASAMTLKATQVAAQIDPRFCSEITSMFPLGEP